MRRRPCRRVEALRPSAAVVAGFLAGSLPVSNWVALRRAGVDLRRVGTGTVSGTGLARVAGNRALVLAGLCELSKGALGPLLAGRGHPGARALAGAAAVTGHNWSPWLGGAGGRGISPAMGALAVSAPAGAGLLLAGLAGGRLAGETAIGSLVADVALVPACRRWHGRQGALAAAAVLLPILVKRAMGNAPPSEPGADVYLWRLLLDRDTARPSPAPEPEALS
jgi:acyl phosphate:glycerol-3-phosphate acyltransferase